MRKRILSIFLLCALAFGGCGISEEPATSSASASTESESAESSCEQIYNSYSQQMETYVSDTVAELNGGNSDQQKSLLDAQTDLMLIYDDGKKEMDDKSDDDDYQDWSDKLVNAWYEQNGILEKSYGEGSSEADDEPVETPQIFKDVSIAHKKWDDDFRILVDQGRDAEDAIPSMNVKSDDNGIVRYICIYTQENSYWSDDSMTPEDAVATIAQYIDTDYLHAHYTFDSSYEVPDQYSNGASAYYYIVYNPDASEQYGQFYIQIQVISGDVYFITAANEGILYSPDEYGQHSVSTIDPSKIAQWNMQI